MKYFDWDDILNNILKENRNISFEEIVISIANNKLLDTVEHPNKLKYPNQKMFIVEVREFAFVVSFIEDDEKYFLKKFIQAEKLQKNI